MDIDVFAEAWTELSDEDKTWFADCLGSHLNRHPSDIKSSMDEVHEARCTFNEVH